MPEVTYGRWSPTEVMERVLDGTWVTATPPEPANTGGVLMSPTSIAYTGTSASINTKGSVSFTACSSLSLNGVFTADYDYYQIMIRRTSTSAVATMGRLRVAGTDASGSNYTYQYIYATSTSVTAARTTATETRLGGSSLEGGDVISIYGPYLAQPTAFRSVGKDGWSGTDPVIIDNASTHSLSTSYDGITLFPQSGTFTGLISVYGLKG